MKTKELADKIASILVKDYEKETGVVLDAGFLTKVIEKIIEDEN